MNCGLWPARINNIRIMMKNNYLISKWNPNICRVICMILRTNSNQAIWNVINKFHEIYIRH
jgi:hypothetical protein